MRVLPTRVLWPQFIANSLLFAAAWVVIVVMARGIARAILARFRTRKGHCPACDYDLTGVAGPVCPECGYERTATPASA
jgi:CBS-domain-containing membrane protein